jgi:glycosyltransferase involved in cell wall biosynthesis
VKVSVVVPAFNEERLLAGSLAAIRAALRAFDEAGWGSELIVCDNNSSDGTAAIARAAGAKVVFEPVNQIARARNAGAVHASGEWLLFVDADSYPSFELFKDVLDAMQGGACLAGGSTVTLESRDLAVRLAIASWNALSRAAGWAAGAFILCDARAFRSIGGFSEKLYAGEEIDFSRRIKRRARSERRSFVILHRHPLATSDRKARLYTKGEYLRFMLKTLVLGGRTLRDRNACYSWYDGRR